MRSITRDHALDGLRGIAILLVIAVHATLVFPEPFVPSWFGRYIAFGGCSIELFFVLSGFLITNVLLSLERSRRGMRAFYVARFFRIFPLYYLFLVLSFWVFPHAFPRAYASMPAFEKVGVWYFGYASNFLIWIHRQISSLLVDVSWSLSVEEQFYLLWPALFIFAPRRFLAVGCLAAAVAAFLFGVAAMALGAPPIGVYASLPMQLAPLALGAYLALVLERGEPGPRLLRTVNAGLVVSAAIVGAILLFVRDFSAYGPWVHVSIFATSCLFACLLARLRSPGCPPSLRRALSVRPLVLAGKYSYAAYLFHIPILVVVALQWRVGERLVGFWPAGAFWIYGLVVFALTFALGAASWHFIESPILRLRDRILG